MNILEAIGAGFIMIILLIVLFIIGAIIVTIIAEKNNDLWR